MRKRKEGIREYMLVSLVLVALALFIVTIINLGDRLWQKQEKSALNNRVSPRQNITIDLSEHLGSDTVPLFFQWDERWGNTIYGSDVMEVTGCGPTCLSMVLVHLLQDATYTPRYVADFAEDNEYYAKGSGSKWALI